VLHRGGGRVARKLVGLRAERAEQVGAAGAWRAAKVFSSGREIGEITSAAESPRFGIVALGYVHRDFTEPGTQLSVEGTAGRVDAVVSSRPLDVARGKGISSAAR
jgi:glycine cleavage system aminomethyltransferase T